MRRGIDVRERLDVAQSKTSHVRKVQRPLPRDVAQRVAAHVAIGGRVRHFADADAVEHDPDHAVETAGVVIAREPAA